MQTLPLAAGLFALIGHTQALGGIWSGSPGLLPSTEKAWGGGGVEEEKQEGMGVARSVQANRNSKDGFSCLQERFLEQSPSFA